MNNNATVMRLWVRVSAFPAMMMPARMMGASVVSRGLPPALHTATAAGIVMRVMRAILSAARAAIVTTAGVSAVMATPSSGLGAGFFCR